MGQYYGSTLDIDDTSIANRKKSFKQGTVKHDGAAGHRGACTDAVSGTRRALGLSIMSTHKMWTYHM